MSFRGLTHGLVEAQEHCAHLFEFDTSAIYTVIHPGSSHLRDFRLDGGAVVPVPRDSQPERKTGYRTRARPTALRCARGSSRRHALGSVNERLRKVYSCDLPTNTHVSKQFWCKTPHSQDLVKVPS